jgi:DNA-3-methyladenine glycosylase II
MATGNRRESPPISKLPKIVTASDVARGVEFLIGIEPRFEAVVASHGVPSARRAENNLASLLQVITEQLISLQASGAIWRRITSSLHPLSPESILATDHDDLRKLGLTNAKTRSFQAIAGAAHRGELNFDSLAEMPDPVVLKKLMSFPGIGPWTADIYLLSALGRADAFPAGDLALQISAQNLFALEERPTPKAFLAMAEAWRPWRSVAARLLWSHYRGLKGLVQAQN